jgi:hypothetical protein
MVLLSEVSTVSVGAVDLYAPSPTCALDPVYILPRDGAEGSLIPFKRLLEDC